MILTIAQVWSWIWHSTSFLVLDLSLLSRFVEFWARVLCETLWNTISPSSSPPSVVVFFLISFAAFAEALEAVDRGGEEEAGHDGHHWDGDAREDDDEVVGEGEGTTALPKTFFGEES